MPQQLEQLERRVYHYMIDFLAENTFQPSIREIARKFRIKSTKTVSDLLQSLERKGYIERDQSRSRGVRILGFAAVRLTQPVPYYSQIAPTEPALAPELRKGFITLDRRFLPSEDVFLLKTAGSSMTARGILDGDYVLVSPSAKPKEGDIVVARVGIGTTIRTLTHHGASVVLESGTADDAPIDVGQQRDDFAILGVVCGVFRPYFEMEVVTDLDGERMEVH